MNRIIVFILLLSPIIANSQDLIVLRNGEKIDCKIIKIDSLKIYYDFQRGERTISSFVNKNEIRSYQQAKQPDLTLVSNDSIKVQHKEVLIDTTKYVKHTYKWNNLITYSQRFGIHANGWSVQYYGYVLQDNSRWIIPCIFGLEGFTINTDYFSQFNYQSANMGYWLAGVSPFKKLNEYIYLNLGLQILFGSEQLKSFNGQETTNTIFGLAPSQGLFFIPKSKFGITASLGIYEKVLSSEVYKNDFGIKLEIGIKF